jgi:hypothetical protein
MVSELRGWGDHFWQKIQIMFLQIRQRFRDFLRFTFIIVIVDFYKLETIRFNMIRHLNFLLTMKEIKIC